MNNILVTGANGQLGMSLRKIADCRNNFYFTDSQELDITSKEAIDDYFRHHKIDLVINCAAYTAVDTAESEPEQARLLNATALFYLVQVAKDYNAVVIHISTDYVFNGTATKPIKESVPTSALGVYGATKLEGEKFVLDYEKGIVIRTSWLYSEYGNNFVKTMLRLGAERKEISVVCDQVGTPTYAGDLAEVIMMVVEDGEHFGLYHFSNQGSCSWAEFASKIMEYSGLSCRVKSITTAEYPTLAERPKYSILDKTKIENTFHCSILPWEESLLKMITVYLYS